MPFDDAVTHQLIKKSGHLGAIAILPCALQMLSRVARMIAVESDSAPILVDLPAKLAIDAKPSISIRLASEIHKMYFIDLERGIHGGVPINKELLLLADRFEHEVAHGLNELARAHPGSAQHVEDSLRTFIKPCLEISDHADRITTNLLPILAERACDFAIHHCPADVVSDVAVVSLDLVEYSRMTEDVDGYWGAQGVFEINRVIKNQIVQALSTFKIKQSDYLMADTGDGAIIYFKNPAEAVNFAVQILLAAGNKNVTLGNQKHKFYYRIGICTGPVKIEKFSSISQQRPLTEIRAGGKVIGKAVRLQSACKIGTILICDKTKQVLEEGLRKSFDVRRKIKGKAHEAEKIPAWEHRLFKKPVTRKARPDRTSPKLRKKSRHQNPRKKGLR